MPTAGTRTPSTHEARTASLPLADVARLSFNQITSDKVDLKTAVDACVRHGVPNISVWRHKLKETGVKQAVEFIRDAGLHVSSICRGGMFPAATIAERNDRVEDNLRAIDEAAALDADVLVLVCGAAPDKDIAGARAMVEDGISRIAHYAADRGVKLGIEPLHPAFAAERSCITTLREARLLAEKFDPMTVGVIADVYHIWWDPDLYDELSRLEGRIFGFHVSDWLVPAQNVLMNRGMMGDGVIELRRIRSAVERSGYHGPIEVEIFNEAVWATPIDELLPLMKSRFMDEV